MSNRRRDHYADSEWNSGWIEKETPHKPRRASRLSLLEWIFYGLFVVLALVVVVRVFRVVV
jgi:hypothetical protein